jgi:hypothetical protein
MPNLSVKIHVSSEERRLSAEEEIGRFVKAEQPVRDRRWVYVSGPTGLSESAETACIKYHRAYRKTEGNAPWLDWYVASYST